MASAVSKRRFFVGAFLLAMTACNLVLPVQVLPKLRNGYQDFTIFYTGALLLRSGHAASLYNLATQYQTQQTFTNVPIRLGPLPFNHPPFEALFFIPFTFLPYWPAYLLWTGMNLVMLAAAVSLLYRYLRHFTEVPRSVLILGTTAFFPIFIGIMQGQDIVVLLLLFVLAILCLGKEQDMLAGALLGAGFFRPQAVCPLVLLLAIRRWRVLVGFIPVASLLVGLSAAFMGWNGVMSYVRFVIHLEGTSAKAFGPEAVPNLRGLISELPGIGSTSTAAHMLIFVASVVVFLWAARRIRFGKDSILFTASLAAATTILINFHGLVYDLTLLFPMVMVLLLRAADGGQRDWSRLVLVTMLYLTPVYIVLLLQIDAFFLFSLIVLWIFVRLISANYAAELPA